MSLYSDHCQRWASGCGSDHCSGARKIVFARGQLPCDILFVGEGPGESENLRGIPFVGVSGKLLDHIIAKSIPDQYRVAFYNIVGCIPRTEAGGKLKEPDNDQIEQCRPRLEEFMAIAQPRMIVAVGTQARNELVWRMGGTVQVPSDVTVIDILHPAAILRTSVSVHGLKIQQCVIAIRDGIEDMERGPKRVIHPGELDWLSKPALNGDDIPF